MAEQKKPRVRVAADGRMGFPEIVEYETGDGIRHAVPPLDGRSYRVIIHDGAEYDRLFRSGWLGLGHAFKACSSAFVDNRIAPGRQA